MALRIATFACSALMLFATTGCQCFSIPSVRYHEPHGPGTAAPLPCEEAWQIAETKHAEQTAPPARFHPLPTRPVFAANAAIAARDSSTAIPHVQLHAPRIGPSPAAPSLIKPPLLRGPEELTPPSIPETPEPEAAPINPGDRNPGDRSPGGRNRADRGVTRRVGRGDIRFITGDQRPSAYRWRIKR